LRLANSAFYGLQRHVESLEDAVAVLGVQSVRTLACVAAVTGTYYWRIQRPEDRWTFESFWRHSMAVALGARAVARQSGLSEGHAFVAGLLHDIGWLVLRTSFPRQLAAVEQEQLQTGERWEVVEARVLGIDHAEIGRILLEHWKFPAALCEAVGDHHPSEAQEHGLGAVVCVANWLDHVRQLPVEQRFSIVSQAHHCCQVLGLSATWWPGVLDELEQQLNGACDVLLRQEES
jgi:putative nucleotidyltransferase with HDIG domain